MYAQPRNASYRKNTLSPWPTRAIHSRGTCPFGWNATI